MSTSLTFLSNDLGIVLPCFIYFSIFFLSLSDNDFALSVFFVDLFALDANCLFALSLLFL